MGDVTEIWGNESVGIMFIVAVVDGGSVCVYTSVGEYTTGDDI